MDRWEQFNLIIDNENLDAKEKSMLLILFRFVQNGTDTAYPSRERIKKLYGSKKNDVIDKVLKSLEDKKLLIREKDSGKKTKYHLYIGIEIEPGITTEPGSEIEPSTIIEPGTQIEPTPGTQIEPTPGSIIEPQKEKKKKNEKKNIYSEVFDFWNSKNIVKHKTLNADMEKTIEKALKKYSKDEIIENINRYSIAVNDDSYYFSMKWELIKFLKQKNAMNDFTESGCKWVEYQSHLKKKSLKNKVIPITRDNKHPYLDASNSAQSNLLT